MDEWVRAIGGGPTRLKLCGTDDAPVTPAACKEAGVDVATQIKRRCRQRLPGARQCQAAAEARSGLVRRNRVSAAESVPQSDDDEAQEALPQACASGSPCCKGSLADSAVPEWRALGECVPATSWSRPPAAAPIIAIEDALGLAPATRPAPGMPGQRAVAPRPQRLADGENNPRGQQAGANGRRCQIRARQDTLIRIRRHGETPVVADDREWQETELAGCTDSGQITASYFATGKASADATPGAADTSFVAPSFDCARPATASEEEICADPDLAGNDVKLNRAWKALLPRLDEVTRRALTEDQRGYVRAQSHQYPQFLHPAWEKQTSQMHYTGEGRDKLYRMQLERIALLEGFDESRSGFAGVDGAQRHP